MVPHCIWAKAQRSKLLGSRCLRGSDLCRRLPPLSDQRLPEGVVLRLRQNTVAQIGLVRGAYAQAVAAVVLGADDALEADRDCGAEGLTVGDEAGLHRGRDCDVI